MVFALKMTMEVPTFVFAKWAGKVNLAINVCHIGIALFKIKLLVSVCFALGKLSGQEPSGSGRFLVLQFFFSFSRD